MTKHAALIARLCEASEGSAELSAEVMNALHGTTGLKAPDFRYEATTVWGPEGSHPAVVSVAGHPGWEGVSEVPCLTTNLSAAWEEAERRGFYPLIDTLARGDGREYEVSLFLPDPSDYAPKGVAHARTPALGIAAAILAAEGER